MLCNSMGKSSIGNKPSLADLENEHLGHPQPETQSPPGRNSHPRLCRCATPHVQRTTPISYANVVYYINLCFCYHSGSKLAPETHALQTRYIFPIACENKITARDTSFVGCRKRREAAKRVQVAKHVRRSTRVSWWPSVTYDEWLSFVNEVIMLRSRH